MTRGSFAWMSSVTRRAEFRRSSTLPSLTLKLLTSMNGDTIFGLLPLAPLRVGVSQCLADGPTRPGGLAPIAIA
jgi:hypothetical protein